MIVLTKIEILMGENVLPEDERVLANWAEFDDDTGMKIGYGNLEIWVKHIDHDKDEWKDKPADLVVRDRKRYKNLDPQVGNVARNLFAQIQRVVEDAVEDGSIDTKETIRAANPKPQWLIDKQNKK